MGVDLDTYRARIGSFISRRNVNCDGEKRKIAIMKERFRLKIDLKAVDSWKPRVLECATINASSSFKKGTHGLDVHVSTKLPMGLLSPKSTHCARHWSRAVAMFILTLLVSYLLIKQLLILSGNIEMNPGPLGQPDPTFTLKNITSALKPVVEWKKLAVQLDISGTKIKEIDVNNRGQMAECKHDMVQFWLESDTSCSWKKLVDALNTCDQSVLAEKVKSTYCPLHEGANLSIYIDPSLDAATLSSIESPKGWNKYTRDLKYRYRNHKPAQVDFPPVATYSYVNLALIKDTTSTHRDEFFLNTIQGSVDDVAETKVTISYHDLFGSITLNNRILLLEGRPGCGKTTLTRKISKDWGEEIILSFVKYLFLIPLRRFNKMSPLNLHIIMEHFQMTDLEVNIAENGGERVCFVFDGLDEYIERYSAQGNSWFEQLLRGEVLSCSTIVITSRPNASVELRKTVNIRGEVVGFLTKQIDEYIIKSYPDSSTKVEELQTYLHSHPNIKHMCYVPLNLVIIIFMFDNCHKKTTPLPETETDVYLQFTIMSLITYFRKKNRKIELKDLESLPSPEISMFQIISKLAYTTVVTSKTSFIPVELRSMFEEISIASLANLGILVVDENEEVCGASHVLTFVHLTHQEFLAAYYASRLSSDKQLKAIREDIVQPHMGVVLKFFCGITKLQNPDHWSVIMKNVLTTEYGEMGPVTLRALHCVFEAQNRQRCRELYSKADGKLHINNETLTLLDYCVIGYCLESASDTVRSIELQCQLTADGLDIITKKLAVLENVKEIKIQDDLCQKEKLLALKHLLQKLPNVKSLDLARCFRDEAWSDWFLLGELLKQTSHLQILRLSVNHIGAEGMEALCTSAYHFSSLTSLNLSWNHIGAEGMKKLCTAASHFSSLTSLNLGVNDIGAEGMESLCTSASYFSSLTSLDLSNNNLQDDSIESLRQIIAQCPLEELYLGITSNSLRIPFKNVFSDEIQKAKCMRPGIKLILDTSTTTANPPRSTTTANPPTSSTAANPPRSATTANPPRSTTTANSPTSTTAANPPRSTTAANPPRSSTTANPPTSTTAANPPRSATTANPPRSATTTNPPRSTTTSIPFRSTTTANPFRSTSTANPSRSTTTANPSKSTTTANPPRSTTIADPFRSSTTANSLTSTTTTANHPSSTTTANPPRSTTTAILFRSTTTANPFRSTTTANPFRSTTTANPPTSTTTANPPRSTTTANPPRSTTTANPPRSTTTANPPHLPSLLILPDLPQ